MTVSERSPVEDMTLVGAGPGDVEQALQAEVVDPAPSPGPRLPYPGLRAFRADETDIFWGRQSALDAMADRLARTRFLAVLGPSGCGKSSLVKTGLYMTLRLGLLPNAGGRWRIAECSPGREPIGNLARALLKAGSDELEPAEPEPEAVDLLEAHLRRGPRSVIEYADGGLLNEGRNLLVVVDQFEELFRYGDYAGREEAEAFVGLLLESARCSLPIHIVITMRSEYIGACSLIPGLAEQISQGMFLTPRMTRDECRQAIERPAISRGFEIEPELVGRILNDLQSFAAFDHGEGLDQAEQLALQADQLPLMQHLLNRIWRQAQAQPGGRPGGPVLTLRDYDDAKGLTGALDAHGKELLAGLETELGPAIVLTVERIFRALVDGPSLPLAVRRPRQFRELVEAAGGVEKRGDVEKVVEAFRGPDCNFLRTSGPRLTDSVVVDLGHESLIRRWSRLKDWFAAEIETRAMWRRLSEDAELWQTGEGGRLRDLGLRRATDWRDREKPTRCLAQRYGGDLDKVQAFIAASESGEAERKRREKRNFYLKLVAGFATVILACWLMISWIDTNARQKYFTEASAAHQKYFTEASAARQRYFTEASAAREAYINQLSINYEGEHEALRAHIGQVYCRGRPRRSPEFETCLNTGVRRFESQYLDSATLRRLAPASAPAPAPGGELH